MLLIVVSDQGVDHLVHYPETTITRRSVSALIFGPDRFYILL